MEKSEILTELRKFKDNGKKIIGLFPHQMVPEEIVHASGAIPLKLCFSGTEEISMKGTEYLTAATCPLARSIIGFFEEGNEFFSLIDAFIGGNYCNGDLCASEYITKYFKLPLIHLPIPWIINPHAVKFYQSLLLNLKQSIENILNVQISDEDISKSINVYNQVRETFQEIAPKIGMGTHLQELLNEFYLLGPDIFLQNLKNKLSHNVEDNLNNPTIAFTGSYVGIDDPILDLIENRGLYIKYNDSESIFYFDKLIPSGDPIPTLAQFYLQDHNSSRMLNSEKRTNQLIAKAKSLNVDGIILHVLKFCDPYVATKVDVKNLLKDNDFAVLEIERDYNESVEQLKTRIEAFREMLK